jgi:hypothetical protein
MGKHRRNQLCNHCGRAQGDPLPDGGSVRLLVDLEEYPDEARVFQAPRSPANPLPLYLVWCVDCAKLLVDLGDPITSFREYGLPDNAPDGPYASYYTRRSAGLPFRRR